MLSVKCSNLGCKTGKISGPVKWKQNISEAVKWKKTQKLTVKIINVR